MQGLDSLWCIAENEQSKYSLDLVCLLSLNECYFANKNGWLTCLITMVGTNVNAGFRSCVFSPWVCNNLLPSVELAHCEMTSQFFSSKSSAHFLPGIGVSNKFWPVRNKHVTYSRLSDSRVYFFWNEFTCIFVLPQEKENNNKLILSY